MILIHLIFLSMLYKLRILWHWLISLLSLFRVFFKINHIKKNTRSKQDCFHSNLQINRKGYAKCVSIRAAVVSSPLFADLANNIAVQVEHFKVNVSTATVAEAASSEEAGSSDTEELLPITILQAEAWPAESELLFHRANGDSRRGKHVDFIAAADARTTQVDHLAARII